MIQQSEQTTENRYPELTLPDSGGDDGSDEAKVGFDSPEVPEDFAVQDAKTASWVARRITEARAYRARVEAWAAIEIRRAEHDERFLLMRFGRQLEAWAAKELERLKGRRRSISLPGGTIGFRKVGPLLVVDDPDAVLEWAKEACPEAVIVSERLVKTPVFEHFQSTGELPPRGARVEPQHNRFYIR